MTLAEFIRQSTEAIVNYSVDFATTLVPAGRRHIDIEALRDHLPLILRAIASDLEQPESRAEEVAKSRGHAPTALLETAAQTHGRLRAESGFTVGQVVAEFRVLRASVTRLWVDARQMRDAEAVSDLIRFNEAIDQAVDESVAFHTREVERWRHMLLAIVGHDLRDPLNTVVMTTQTLETQAGRGPFAESIGLLKRGGDRLRVLLDSLIEYADAGLGVPMTLHRSNVDLDRACRSEIELLRSAFPAADIRVTTAGPSVGYFDESRIRQALANLVANAVQYRIPGTPIRVHIDGESDPVAIAVANKAQPIEQHLLDSLFEPLRRRDKARSGTRRNLGLGLFVVKEIADAHGGHADAESHGYDVTFRMRLPRGQPGQ